MRYSEAKGNELTNGNSIIHELLSHKAAKLGGDGPFFFGNRYSERWVA